MLTEFRPTYNSDNRDSYIECDLSEDDIIIGSTVRHIFNLPFNFDNYIESCSVIYKQGLEVVLIKTDYEIYETPMRATITVILSPEETRLFTKDSLDTYVQLKVVTTPGDVLYNKPSRIKVKKPTDSKEVLKFSGDIWQWDTNLELTTTLNDNDIIQFRLGDDTLSVNPVGGKATIPNQLLEKSGPLYVYAVKDDNGSSKTISKQVFDVKSRPKPAEYIEDPTPVITYPELVDLVTDLDTLKLNLSIWNVEIDNTTGDPTGEVSFDDEGAHLILTGIRGPQGARGLKGDPGHEGPEGAPGRDGISVASGRFEERHLILTLSNGQEIDCGECIPDVSDKVNKSGDTMTGDLSIENSSLWIKDTEDHISAYLKIQNSNLLVGGPWVNNIVFCPTPGQDSYQEKLYHSRTGSKSEIYDEGNLKANPETNVNTPILTGINFNGNKYKVDRVSDEEKSVWNNKLDNNAPVDDNTYGIKNGRWSKITTDTPVQEVKWGNIEGAVERQTDLYDKIKYPYKSFEDSGFGYEKGVWDFEPKETIKNFEYFFAVKVSDNIYEYSPELYGRMKTFDTGNIIDYEFTFEDIFYDNDFMAYSLFRRIYFVGEGHPFIQEPGVYFISFGYGDESLGELTERYPVYFKPWFEETEITWDGNKEGRTWVGYYIGYKNIPYISVDKLLGGGEVNTITYQIGNDDPVTDVLRYNDQKFRYSRHWMADENWEFFDRPYTDPDAISIIKGNKLEGNIVLTKLYEADDIGMMFYSGLVSVLDISCIKEVHKIDSKFIDFPKDDPDIVFDISDFELTTEGRTWRYYEGFIDIDDIFNLINESRAGRRIKVLWDNYYNILNIPISYIECSTDDPDDCMFVGYGTATTPLVFNEGDNREVGIKLEYVAYKKLKGTLKIPTPGE